MTSSPLRSLPARLVKHDAPTTFKATWWGQRPGGNWYWRCEIPSRHLPGQVVQLRYDDLQPTADGPSMPRQLSDTAIWSYAGNATRGILMSAQMHAGYRVLLEVDDNYLMSAPQIPGGKTDWQLRADTTADDRHSLEAHRRLAEVVDGVIVTTEHLAKSYRKVNEHVYVCPNSADLADWEEPEKPDDGILRIGYAASSSHWWDIREIERACSWAAIQPNVQVCLYGLDRGWSFPFWHAPWTQDLGEYRRSLQRLDVGLCPLRTNPWSDCKSDIKAIEYALSGAMPIVSDTVPYDPWLDRVPVATTSKEFLKAVKWAVANRDGVKEYAAKAKQYVVAERTIEKSIDTWKEAVGP